MEIQTRKNEVVTIATATSDMLGKYAAEDIVIVDKEDFIDEESGETITMDRRTVLYSRGQFLGSDELQKITFYLGTGDIQSVKVSNQCRKAYEVPVRTGNWKVKFLLGSDRKNRIILLSATDVENVKAIVNDYLELHYAGPYAIMMIKRADDCIYIDDTLKENVPEDAPENEPVNQPEKKFYSILVNIAYTKEGTPCSNEFQEFLVNTYNTDRGLLLINNYLKKLELQRFEYAREHDEEYNPAEFQVSIEKCSPTSIEAVIPMEYTLAYTKL